MCKHVNVNFEPFMYLSVPLPNGAVRQLEVVLVRPGSRLRYRLNLTPVDTVGKLKTKLCAQAGISMDISDRVKIVEVYNHHISRKVEDFTPLHYLKTDCQTIYAIQTLPCRCRHRRTTIRRYRRRRL